MRYLWLMVVMVWLGMSWATVATPSPSTAPAPDDRPAAAPASAPDVLDLIKVEAPKSLAELVRDLGAARYDLREQAAERLRRMGLAGSPAVGKALEQAAASDDPEVSVRARDILTDLRLGITPDWPAEMVLLARHYGGLTAAEKTRAINRVGMALKEKAAAFLVNCLLTGEESEAAAAENWLTALKDEAVYQLILARIGTPKDDRQLRVRNWALARSPRPMEALAAPPTTKPDPR